MPISMTSIGMVVNIDNMTILSTIQKEEILLIIKYFILKDSKIIGPPVCKEFQDDSKII
jgi:hypothetical protein